MAPTVTQTSARSILSRPTSASYVAGWDFTLTPYTGCSFACSYCYVPSLFAFFNSSAARSWGESVVVKSNAVTLLEREAARGRLAGRTVYLSPNTDPYLPQERRLGLTRELLGVLARADLGLVRVQTRAPLVARDFDLLTGPGLSGRTLLAMSVTTDNEAARRRFEPRCAPIAARLAALAAARESGISTQACVTPLLPGTDVARLADLLAPVAAHVVVQGFQRGAGARTWAPALALLTDAEQRAWSDGGPSTTEATEVLRERFGTRLRTGQPGFAPDIR